MKTIIVLFIAFCIFIPQTWAQQKYVLPDGITENDYMQGKIIFKFLAHEKDNFSDRNLQQVFNQLNVNELIQKFPYSPIPTEKYNEYGSPLVDISLIYELSYKSDTEIDYAINMLLECGLFEYALPHIIPQLLYTPNDPNIGNQYYLNNIQAFAAWDIHQGDSNYVVGITDTGIEFAHPDLVDAVKYNYNDPIDGIDNDNDGYLDNFRGWDMGAFDNNPQYDQIGHGIHVSGIVGASVNNTFGMAGIGFKCKILPVKIDNSYGSLTATYESIIYAADHDADFINCSWGSTYSSGQYGQDIINYVTHNCNALVVAAAGNSNNGIPFYPASFTYVLNVAATDINDVKWSNSSYGYTVDLSAPGKDVYSTWAGSSFISSSGTSMASPCAAGCAAFVASYYPLLNYLQIAERLRNTTDYIDTLTNNLAYANQLGTGRINMYIAVTDTFRPGLRLIDYSVTDNNNEVYGPGDTLDIEIQVINYLNPSDSLIIRLECLDPYVSMVDSVWFVGVLNTLEDSINIVDNFRVKINANTPPSTKLNFIVHFNDTNYHSTDYFFFSINKDYLTLDTNKIAVTITSHGNIGYNDLYNFIQGEGFRYSNNTSMVSGAGFMIGSSNLKVSDNLYSIVEPLDSDFVAELFVQKINPPLFGDQCIKAQFNDTGADSALRNNVKITQYAYAWDTPEDENYVIMKYYIQNTGTNDLNNVYAGFFADWDINTAETNRCFYDISSKCLISCPIDSSKYVAIKLLNPELGFHYAADIDGFNGSITITDGFTSMEKYTMMSSSRLTSGTNISGNDITAMVSNGPYTIAAGDTISISFALIAGFTYLDIAEGATNAQIRFNDPDLGINESVTSDFILYPNPAKDKVYFNLKNIHNSNCLSIININGKVVHSENNIQDGTCIDISKFPTGLYIFIIKDNEKSSSQRLLILR